MNEIVIVGGGPAGLTAAIYALRAGKNVLLFEKNAFGGQIAYSPKVENIPGTKSISGAEFADNLVDQAISLGAELNLEKVTSITRYCEGFYINTEESQYTADAVILATGVKHRTLGLPDEDMLIGNGISFCAVCDGAFYENQHVVVVGGGNSALQEAIMLSEVCSKVTVIQNLSLLTGEQRLVDTVLSKDNIEVHYDSVVTAYMTENDKLQGVVVHNLDRDNHQNIHCDGVFLAIGLEPENDAFKHLVPLDDRGYFDVPEHCSGVLPGLFVAGDCRAKQVRQVTTAASDGAIAAVSACKYLDSL